MTFPRYEGYKDSGVEWLGEVPEGWEVLALKHLIILNPKKSLCQVALGARCTFLPMDKLKDGYFINDEERLVKDVFAGYTFFENGDILQAKVTPCFENGNIAIAEKLTSSVGFGSSEINVIRGVPGSFTRFLFYRLQEEGYKQLCIASMTGVAGLKRVPGDAILGFKIALPPKEEQIQIARFLDYETARIDALIEEAQRSKTLLQERRSALISAAVTGKIDVRKWQPGVSVADSHVQEVANG